jgi:hypothetical protein
MNIFQRIYRALYPEKYQFELDLKTMVYEYQLKKHLGEFKNCASPQEVR